MSDLISQTLHLHRREDSVWFDGESTPTQLLIDVDVWAEWNYPQQIEVTIRPERRSS